MTEKYEHIAALSQGLLSGIVGPQGWSTQHEKSNLRERNDSVKSAYS